MIVTQSAVAAIFKGYRILFSEAYQGGAAPQYTQFATTVQSSNLSEEYDFLNSFPSMREMLGEAVIKRLRATGFTIANREWEATIGLAEKLVRSDGFGKLNSRAQMMGVSARQQPDALIAQLLKDGFTTGLDYTGSAFFSAGKTSYAGATAFTNVNTGQINAARFEAARARLKSRQNDEGRPMGLGQKLILLVSPTWEATARKILTAELTNGGDTNVNRGTADLIVWPQLSASGMDNYWFLLEAGMPVKPFIFQEELAPSSREVTDPNDSYVVKNHEFLFQVYASNNVGYCLPQLIEGSNGTVA